MSNLFPVPNTLKQAEYTLLVFQMEAREYFDLPSLGLLRLRREFHQAIRTLTESGEDELGRELNLLMNPPLPVDPKLRKQVQRPAPPFVLCPDLDRCGLVEPGDQIELPVLFLGTGILAIEAFAQMLQQVGRQGLLNGHGVCELTKIEVENGNEQRTVIWNDGPLVDSLTPLVNDLKWWLDRQPPEWNRLQMKLISPMRLMHCGKPLFRAGFSELFPFLLRRVTSMLAAHCNVETVSDPAALLDAAQQVEESANQLQWRDWRPLTAERGGQDLGGLYGALELTGSELAELIWVLQLGSLFQVGKGAPYGAGCYQLFF